MANMICQLFHSNLDQYFIQRLHYLNCKHLCYYRCVSTSVYIYSLGQEKYPILYVRSYLLQQHINLQIEMKIIVYIYVRIMFFVTNSLNILYLEVISNIQC